MIKKVSIIACGWLGKPLGKFLSNKGYKVKGSTTTSSKLKTLINSGIEPYLLELGKDFEINLKDFLETDLLIVCIPPSVTINTSELAINQIIEAAVKHNVSRILYTSATSVYPSNNNIVNENDAKYIKSPHSGIEMLKLEELFTEKDEFKTTVLRLAGLFGPDRLPGKYLAGKTNLPNGSQPVNMIHLEDCISIISRIIEKDVFPDILNACSDQHPSRKEFYSAMAKKNNWQIPEFSDGLQKPYKIVSNQKLKEVLTYQFIYPNPIDAL